VWADRRASRMAGHRIVSALKASPKGEGFTDARTSDT
jgi:hypothetical protein